MDFLTGLYIIGTPKIKNNFGAIELLIFQMLRS